MKKFLPILILLCACQKEDVGLPEKIGELQAVRFDISGFEREIEPMTKASVTANEDSQFLSAVRYYVYDQDGNLVNEDYKYDSDEYTFHDSLPAGNYKVVFLGLSREDPFNSFMVPQHMDQYATAVFGPEDRFLGIDDFFFKIIDLEVGSQPVIMSDILMQRGIGALRVELTDESLPDDASYQMEYHINWEGFPITSPEPDDQVIAAGWSSAWWNKSEGHPFEGLIYPNRNSGKLLTDVTISATSSGGDTLAVKTVPDVLIERGKRTILRGKLFDTRSQEFTVTADSCWSDGGTIDF